MNKENLWKSLCFNVTYWIYHDPFVLERIQEIIEHITTEIK